MCGVLEEYSSPSTRCRVDPKLSMIDVEVVNSMLLIRNGVDLISTVTGFKSVVLDATTSVDLKGNSVESDVGNI